MKYITDDYMRLYDYMRFGNLDEVSAFQFESYLRSL